MGRGTESIPAIPQNNVTFKTARKNHRTLFNLSGVVFITTGNGLVPTKKTDMLIVLLKNYSLLHSELVICRKFVFTFNILC